MAIIDSLEAARKLRNAGMDESQAEAIVEIIGNSTDDLTTKEDATQLKSAIQSELNQFKAEIRSELAESKSEIAQFKAEIRSELAESKAVIQSELNQFKSVIQSELAQSRADSKSELSLFKGNFYRALWIQGLSLVVIVGAFVTAATALG